MLVNILLGIIVIFFLCGYGFQRASRGKGVTDSIAYMIICYAIVFISFISMTLALLFEHLTNK